MRFTFFSALLLLFSSLLLTQVHAQELSEPVQENSFIEQWVKENIVKILTLSHEDYTNDMRTHNLLFTKKGYPQYSSLLKSSHVLNQLDLRQASMQPILLKDPQVCMRDLSIEGEIIWAVSVPVSLKYRREDTTGEYISPPHKLTMFVKRSNARVHPDKIAIDHISFSAQPMKDINADFCHADNVAREIMLFTRSMPKDVLKDIQAHMDYYKLKYGFDEDFSICRLIETMGDNLRERVSKSYNIKRCQFKELYGE